MFKAGKLFPCYIVLHCNTLHAVNHLAMTKPVNVRFQPKTKEALEAVSRKSGLSVSDLVRLSVDRNLPKMQAGHIQFESGEKQPAKQPA